MKVFKLLSLINIVCLITLSAYSQNNTWYFGNNAGMDFSSGSPLPLTNGVLFAYDCSSSISDINGNLLFYTDGVRVYNKNHIIMPNGSGLFGNNNAGQTALIVPHPAYTNLFYLFTVDVFVGANGFNYHIIDMNLNNGLGDVISKNNTLFSPSTERIDAYYNACENTYWVLTHQWNSNIFSAYKIDANGLNNIPVNSSVGSQHSGNSNNALGQMTITKDGKKVICAIYGSDMVEIFDFNSTTGSLSNPIVISGYTRPWGIAVSANSSILYLSQWYGQNITQFNLNAGSQTNIVNSATQVGSVSGPGTSGYHVGFLELAPDSKIYCAVYDDTYLGVINSPNILGSGCNVIDNGFFLGGKKSNAGLCRTVSFNQIEQISNSLKICQGDSIFFNGGYINTEGTYIDTLKNQHNCDSIIHTLNVSYISPTTYIYNDTICSGDSILLFGNWYDEEGVYSDTIKSNDGCDSTYYLINVYEIYCGKLIIPNVFSPNGDGINDLFLVDGNIQDLEISIYNRWGELLHNSKGKNTYWDGYTYAGKQVSDGTYYYVLNIQYTDEAGAQKNEVFTGHLTLTRD